MPATGQDPGSSSSASRIFSTTTYAPPVPSAQPVQVPLRVAQAVHVVDPQPVDGPVRDQLQDQAVGVREDRASSTRSPTNVSMSKNRR